LLARPVRSERFLALPAMEGQVNTAEVEHVVERTDDSVLFKARDKKTENTGKCG
jgi:hypothetical protein